MLSDVSSEMVYPLNPIFITRVLGAPAWALGLIEGIAESTASLVKLYAGWISDQTGKRKPFAVAGYAAGAIGKPMIALSLVWWHVLLARFIDRLGKGLRTAPRDALIAENCAPEQRGRAYGFHRSMDTLGAVIGPLLGFAFVRAMGPRLGETGAFRNLYLLAFIPGILGVMALAWLVREQGTSPAKGRVMPSWRNLSPAYRHFLLIVGIFSIGNSSDTFLILRSRDLGVAEGQVFLLYALFNVVEALLGYPAGRLSDRVGRRILLTAGYAVFGLVYLGFALARSAWLAWPLFVVYGLYYTLTQGVQRAMAADLADPAARAGQIGAFHMVIGVMALPASLVAGRLYGIWTPAPFLLGAVTAGVATAMMAVSAARNRVDSRRVASVN